MNKNTLPRLHALSTEVLAEALYDLAKQSDEAKVVVDRLTQSADEAYKATKRAISALKHSTKFIDWRDIPNFVRKLEGIVQDLDELDITDVQRFDLTCRFFETDNATFSRVDDSSGYVQEVYKISAQAVFNQCAYRLATTDQALVAKELEHLLKSNDYGIRDYLLDEVISYLDDATNRSLISRFSAHSDQTKDIYGAQSWLRCILQIAKHLKDTKLFELTALESVAHFDEVPVSTRFDIAKNYYEAADSIQAKKWMDKIDASEHFMLRERNQFLVALHSELGNPAERDRIAREEFNRAPSAVALGTLLSTIGEQHRAAILAEQKERIMAENEYADNSLSFLIDTEQLELASQYAIHTRDTINGDYYWHLPKQGAYFIKANYLLAGICIYRALLDSILRRANTKTYYYGVRYLIKLDQLCDTEVVEGMIDHAAYKKDLVEVHGRKRSFWQKYDAAV